MGIFGKDKKSNGTEFEVADFAANENNLEFDTKSSDGALDGSRQLNSRLNSEYGIQDAIELMRELPNVNTDIVISVVIKTLESASIQVSEIILDAQERESRIEKRSVELSSKIEQLDAQITQLNEEITSLNSDFEETTNVKRLLEASLQRADSKKSEKREEKTAVVAETVTAEKTAEKNEIGTRKKEVSTEDTAKPMITADNLSLIEDAS